MKKRVRIFLLCFFLLAFAVGLSYLLKSEKIPLFKTETTLAQSSASSVLTTAEETTVKSETTVSTTQPSTLIDLNSLSVIDLFPLSLAGGGWDVKHCQGIAVDSKKGFIYYSYTTLLVKCDFDGNIVGSISAIKGHLGDIAFNEKDRKLYCGYYSENRQGFYVLIFDTDKITKTDMKPTKDLVRSVFISEAYKDYKDSVVFETEAGSVTKRHRYGCSGIDAITFGPDFQKGKGSKELLTVAYGIYSETDRTDNDYQVLLQYDVSSWWDSIAKPFSNNDFHRSGPESFTGKYFVYTGNTKYGVQTMEYFDELNLWILNCYHGQKEKFQKFRLFVIDADVKPKKTELIGQSTKDEQYVLSLYQDGTYDKETDIYGWDSSFGVQGIAYMHDGLFYIVRPYKSWTGRKTAICYLNVWAPENSDPFILAAGIGNDYSISKKPRITTTAPKTTVNETETEKAVGLIDALNKLKKD